MVSSGVCPPTIMGILWSVCVSAVQVPAWVASGMSSLVLYRFLCSGFIVSVSPASASLFRCAVFGARTSMIAPSFCSPRVSIVCQSIRGAEHWGHFCSCLANNVLFRLFLLWATSMARFTYGLGFSRKDVKIMSFVGVMYCHIEGEFSSLSRRVETVMDRTVFDSSIWVVMVADFRHVLSFPLLSSNAFLVLLATSPGTSLVKYWYSWSRAVCLYFLSRNFRILFHTYQSRDLLRFI